MEFLSIVRKTILQFFLSFQCNLSLLRYYLVLDTFTNNEIWTKCLMLKAQKSQNA